MPTRVHDIAKKLGLDNKEVLIKAKELGITAAKVPSSSLDKITAEWLEEEIIKASPDLAANLAPKPIEEKPRSAPPEEPNIPVWPKPRSQLADDAPNSNPTLRFEIKISGTWSTAFMRQLQSKGISIEAILASEHDQTEKIRLHLIPDATNITGKAKLEKAVLDEKTRTLLMAAYGAASANKIGDWVTLASFGGIIKKLSPDFKTMQFGSASLSELIKNLPDFFETKTDTSLTVPVIYLRPKSQNENGLAKRTNGHVMSLHGGYGFIKPEVGDQGLFFHASDLIEQRIESLKVGDSVSYILGTNERGPCAKAVRVISV